MMTFVYIIKKFTGKWINTIAKNNFAQALVMQETPSISLSLLPSKKRGDTNKCCNNS
jgi:hypothetical protein